MFDVFQCHSNENKSLRLCDSGIYAQQPSLSILQNWPDLRHHFVNDRSIIAIRQSHFIQLHSISELNIIISNRISLRFVVYSITQHLVHVTVID